MATLGCCVLFCRTKINDCTKIASYGMPEYKFNLYPLSQIPGVPANSIDPGDAYDVGGTVTFTGIGTSVTITDDDEFFEDYPAPADGNPENNPETGTNAVLTDAVTVNGNTYPAGTQVNAVAQVEVVNNTTGETGFAQILDFGGNYTLPDSNYSTYQSYLTYPFSVSDGDSLTFIATDNSNRVSPDKFGDTQGYAYSDFDAPTAPVETYTFHTFSQSDVGFPQTSAFSNDGIVFVHDATNPITKIAVNDDDAVLDDQSTNDGQTYDPSEILQSVNGDTSISGNDIASFASYTVTGDDGSSFKAHIIAGSQGSAIRDIDGSAVTGYDTYLAFAQPLIDGVEYTYSEYSPIGQVAYADLAEQGSAQPPLVTDPPTPDGSHSTTEIIVSGADVGKNPVVNSNSSAGYQSQGQITVNAESVFQDDDIVVLKVNQVDANGEISPTSNSGLADVTVYDSYEDYLAGTVKYHYAPQNPGQTADVQSDISGLGDGYVRFASANIMQPQNGGPSFDQLFVALNSGIGSSGSGTFSTQERFDFNSDGDFDDFLEDGNTNFLVGTYAIPPVCFTRGTLIKTDQGELAIEELAAGDMVLTMDHEYQPIRWIGSSKRAATGDLAPILIRKGALGNDRDLRVSPQHRMLLQGWQAEMLFGEVEVLATAKSLLNDHSILRDEGGEVEYFHMLFDRHEIIYAEGCLSESFHPGKQGWKALDQATRDEILTLFPQLADGNFNDYGPAARMSLKHKEGKLLGSYMAGSSPSTKNASSSSPTWLAAFSLKLMNRLRPSGWFQ